MTVHLLQLFTKFELYVRLNTSFQVKHSHIKIHLRAHFIIQLQERTNYSDNDRCTYDQVPVSTLDISLLTPSTVVFLSSLGLCGAYSLKFKKEFSLYVSVVFLLLHLITCTIQFYSLLPYSPFSCSWSSVLIFHRTRLCSQR